MRFNCQFTTEEQVVTVNAQLLGDTMYCDVVEFTSNAPETTATIKIVYGGTRLMENPNNVRGMIFWLKKKTKNVNGFSDRTKIPMDQWHFSKTNVS